MKRLAITWIILTSIIYLINNYYYYLSKETEANFELDDYVNTISLFYNNSSEQNMKEILENIPLNYRYHMKIESYDNNLLKWEILKDSRIETNRSIIEKSMQIHGNSENNYLDVKITAYISPPWWKGLIRAWSWSFWETEGWWEYRLYQRSLPLYSYGAILFLFGILFKYFVDNYYKTKIQEADKIIENIDIELKTIDEEKENLANEKQKIEIERESIKKEKEDLKSLDAEVVDHLSELDEREKKIYEKELMLNVKEDGYKKNKEKAEKIVEPENENKRRILFRVIDNEIKNYLTKKETEEKLSYHGEYQNYKKMADKIINTDMAECFSRISNCEYQSAHRKTINIKKSANDTPEIQVVSDNDKGTAISLSYDVKDSKYLSPVGFSLSMLLKIYIKDFKAYKIRILS